MVEIGIKFGSVGAEAGESNEDEGFASVSRSWGCSGSGRATARAGKRRRAEVTRRMIAMVVAWSNVIDVVAGCIRGGI